jgi:hypothetical protein
MKITIYEAKEVEVPDTAVYWAWIGCEGKPLSVRKIMGEDCIEASATTGCVITKTRYIWHTMDRYTECQPEIFYGYLADQLSAIADAAGIEYHQLQGGAYAD